MTMDELKDIFIDKNGKEILSNRIINYNFEIKNNKLYYKQHNTDFDYFLRRYKESRLNMFSLFFSWLYHEGILYEWIGAYIDTIITEKLTTKLNTNKINNIYYLFDLFFVFSDYDNILSIDDWNMYRQKWNDFVIDNNL